MVLFPDSPAPEEEREQGVKETKSATSGTLEKIQTMIRNILIKLWFMYAWRKLEPRTHIRATTL